MGIFGKPWERDVIDNGDKVWQKVWDRDGYIEKEVRPDHGDPYIDRTYRDGQTYREDKDGNVEKVTGK